MANANDLSGKSRGQTGAGASGLEPDAQTAGQRSMTVVGAGSIGVRLATAFLLGGFRVALYDPDPARLRAAPQEIEAAAADLIAAGLAPAQPDLIDRLSCTSDLPGAACDAALVVEAAPEKLDLKQEIFAALDAAAPSSAVLASASSALYASQFTAELQGRHRCLVAHPVNPPHVIKMIELVPAPFTDAETVQRARALFAGAGYDVVTVQRETTGFAYNRLQGAVLREAYCLVRDGVISVDDLDRLVRDALGFRWSVVGPFETVDLNTRGGVRAHAQKLGPAYEKMGAERGQHDPWTEDLVDKVAEARRRALPLEDWEDRVAWRDRELTALAAYRAGRTKKES